MRQSPIRETFQSRSRSFAYFEAVTRHGSMRKAAGTEAVLDVLTSSAAYAVELRSTSPFAGVLSEEERNAVLVAFEDSRRERARPMRMETLERVLRAV